MVSPKLDVCLWCSAGASEYPWRCRMVSRTPGFCGAPCTLWSFSPLLAPWVFCLCPSSAFHLEKSLTQTAGLTSHASSELVINPLCSCPFTRSRASTTFFYLFWEGPDSKYFRLFGLASLCHTYSALPLSHVSSPREYINERVWLFSNKLHLWTLKLEFQTIFMCHKTVFFWFVLMT